MQHIDCIHYYQRKCSHPSSKGLFGHKLCVLVSDERCVSCKFKIEHDRPKPPPAPPPRKV